MSGEVNCRECGRDLALVCRTCELGEHIDRLSLIRSHVSAYRQGIIADPVNVLRRIWLTLGEDE